LLGARTGLHQVNPQEMWKITFAVLPPVKFSEHDNKLNKGARAGIADIGVFFRTTFGLSLPTGTYFLELNNSAAYANGDGLRAIIGPKLLHDVLDVNFDSMF
jgi:hypothetical protein